MSPRFPRPLIATAALDGRAALPPLAVLGVPKCNCKLQGFLWLATRNDEAGVWTQAGGSFATEYGGLWEEDDDDDDDNEEEEGGGGDEGEHKEGGRDGSDGAGSHAGRTTELVFIGLGMDHDALKAELRLCLLTDEEIEGGPEAWRERFEDPFPPWQ